VEHEFLLEVLEELYRSLDVDEERVNLPDVLDIDLGGFALLRNEVGRCYQMDRVSERGILADLG
jgi:ABC-type transporter Mla MlaB component